LNGVYTIGPTGDFATIGGAIAAVTTEGVSGPVIFKIQSGTYNETNTIAAIPFISVYNFVVFESMAANPDSVIITHPTNRSFKFDGASFVVLQNLTLQDIAIRDTCRGIVINGNKFTFQLSSEGIEMQLGKISDFTVSNNTGVIGIINPLEFGIDTMEVSGNSFMNPGSFLFLHNANWLSIQKNTGIGNVEIRSSTNVDFSGNKVSAFSPNLYPFQINTCSHVIMTNNFISDDPGSSTAIFNSNNDLQCINNGFETQGRDTTLICINNDSLQLRNNIYDNDSGGIAISYDGNTRLNSDFNAYYNGGGLSNMFSYNGTAYTFPNFQVFVGQDHHSVVKNIIFISPTDLHLHSSHRGDQDLIGAPHPLVSVDIDGQPRNPLYPYKGADEMEIALPVELSSFTASVNGNNVLLKWTTSTETNNSEFVIERSEVKGQVSDEWIGVGSVNGNGTTNYMHEYNFIDKNLLQGRYNYRLKQIDYNGNFVYYNLSSEVVIGIRLNSVWNRIILIRSILRRK
jgi:hypothetical protein